MPHPTDPSCIFCKIAAGHIPCHKVFEDDLILAFLDIGPLVPGHTLIIPKAHYATLLLTPPELAAEIARRLPAIAQAVLAATNTKACHILINSGPEAQQSVPHLHYHILPRQSGDSFHIPWHAGKLDPAAAQALAQAITRQLDCKP
jgi:histidine triad (HIT) family protein